MLIARHYVELTLVGITCQGRDRSLAASTNAARRTKQFGQLRYIARSDGVALDDLLKVLPSPISDDECVDGRGI